MKTSLKNLNNKNIILGVTGSIAAYKAAEICSKLIECGANVYPILTESACRFIQPLTFETLSKNKAMTDMWENDTDSYPNHIKIADSADIFLVAPASADSIAKITYGHASDLLSSVHLAIKTPAVIAPAMNGNMYNHPATQYNINTLIERGYHIVKPEIGMLACGYEGIGKLASVESILEKTSSVV